jgi:hypothetical protein
MKKVGIIVGIIAVIAVIVGVAVCVSTPGTPSTTAPSVIYKIEGTANTVDVTLNNPTGGTEQYSNVAVPVQYSYDSFSDNFVYISAQNNGETGTVTVSIYVNNNLFKTSTSSGAYVIATASGSIE